MVDPKALGKEFREFLLRTNMIALAMGVIIGASASKVVHSIIHDILGTVFDVLVPHSGWAALNVNVWRLTFRFGNLLSALIEFAIVALVVFMITKAFIRSAPAPATKTCPECVETIPVEAKRCKFCTTELPKPA